MDYEFQTTINTINTGGNEKELTTADCVAEMIFGYLASRGTGAPPHLTLGYSIAQYTKRAVGLWFMAAWVKDEENASKHRQKKREAEEADKVEFAPGVTAVALLVQA